MPTHTSSVEVCKAFFSADSTLLFCQFLDCFIFTVFVTTQPQLPSVPESSGSTFLPAVCSVLLFASLLIYRQINLHHLQMMFSLSKTGDTVLFVALHSCILSNNMADVPDPSQITS